MQPWTYLPDFAGETLPRYTSYPPANRFGSDVSWPNVEDALRALPASPSLSLYVHIPYCQRLCWYCGCHTSVPTKADPIEDYIFALLTEIELFAPRAPSNARISHLHFGGGSPDSLTPDQITAILDRLHAKFSFAPDAEIAAELDPRGATQGVVDAFVSGGMNRVSFGLQDINPDIQNRINRKQSCDQIAEAVDRVRQAGVTGLNLDMMYGLPGQTVEHVERTADFVANMEADRVAVFGYAHVPWFKKHQKAIDTRLLAEGEERFRQAEAAARSLGKRGFVPVGFDHFAQPGDSLAIAQAQGTLRRNFQGYTVDQADGLIAFGASSISSLPGLYWQNAPDTATYKSTLQAGELPIVRGIPVTKHDRIIARHIEDLLCFGQTHLPDTLAPETRARIDRLVDARLVECRNGLIHITDVGRPYARNVAATFDPGFLESTGRHSLAV